MALHDWWQLLYTQVMQTGWLQWLAVITGVAEVLFARSNNILLYPTGIVSTLITIYIFAGARLYADSMLNLYYFVMSVYGWWYWVKKKNLPAVKISYCTRKDWITVLLIVAVGFVLLATLLKLTVLIKYITPSNVPYWDAWASATAWAGMWLLAKRKIENWALLNISNAFYIPLYFYKQLPLFALLTVFLFVVAIMGHFEWKKIIKKEAVA